MRFLYQIVNEAFHSLHFLAGVRQQIVGLVKDHLADSLGILLVRIRIAAATTHPLYERGGRRPFRDEKVGIQIQRHFANLCGDGQNGILTVSRPKGIHDRVMPLLSINHFVATMVAKYFDVIRCS